MVNFSFTDGLNYYGYAPGVNAANLTFKNIQDANARIDPFRQRLIRDGKLKATQSDPGYKSPETLAAETKPKNTYGNWSWRELANAIIARRIKSKAELIRSKQKEKRDLITILEEADKHPEFHRYMELAPELRDMITKLAIKNETPINLPRVCPRTPAICRLNHQTRDETLPIFFRATCQTIVVSAKPGRSRPLAQGRSIPTQTAKVDEKTQRFFIHAEKKGWLQHMRHFHFRLMGRTLNGNGTIGKDWNDRYFVNFSNTMQTVATCMKKKDKENDRENCLEGIQAKMAAITDGESESMTPSAFDSMMAIFMGSVVERSS